MSRRTVIVGAAGRMGAALVRCLHAGRVPGLVLHGAVDSSDAEGIGQDCGLLAGCGETGVLLTDNLPAVAEEADVVIDFSVHWVTAAIAPQLAQWGTAHVIGTTGLSSKEQDAVNQAAQQVPVVMAPNMSLGVNLLFTLVEQAARALKGRGYDIEIVEKHHRRKKDAPSGTALGLGKAAAAGSGWNLDQVAVNGREGLFEGDRPAEQIGFHAVRGGDFVGDHDVIFAAEGECIELSHRATSRDTFATGALQAAAWTADRPAGFYTMLDVLGL